MPVEPTYLFREFLKDFTGLAGLFGKGVILAPVIIKLASNLAPPWPAGQGLPFVTSVVELSVLIFVFQRASHYSKAKLDRHVSRGFIAFLALLLCYLFLFSFFVFDAPDSANRDVKGLYYTKLADQTISDTYPEGSALAGAGYDPTLIWKPWTVYLMRVSVAAIWLSVFSWLAALIGFFAIRQNRDQKRRN